MEKIVALQQDKDLFVDSQFLNSCQNIIPNSELKHMGFGEFYLVTPVGEIQFARRDGKITWEGISGRPHRIYDNVEGKLVAALVKGFGKKLNII